VRADSKISWINPTVIGIGLASLFSDVGHEMATAAMPALLASIGASSAAVGIIEGLADGLSSFAKLFSGIYSDRLTRRKPIAIIGYFLTASGMASFALATQWWHVLIGRVGGWVGRGARTPVRNVLLTEATTPETYGRAFGLERSMDTVGAVLGPLLALLLIPLVGIRGIFVFTLIPGLIAALLITFLVKEKAHTSQVRVPFWVGIKSLPDQFYKYLWGIGIAGIGDFSRTLLILWATQAFAPAYGMVKAAALAMFFYVIYNVVNTFSCYISGQLADRFPKRHLLALGYVLAVIPAIALILPIAPFIKFPIAFGFSGIYMGIAETLTSATAATLLPSTMRGTGFGLMATINGIGDMVSSITVGCLWSFSPVWAMSFVIFTSLLGAGFILFSSSLNLAQNKI